MRHVLSHEALLCPSGLYRTMARINSRGLHVPAHVLHKTTVCTHFFVATVACSAPSRSPVGRWGDPAAPLENSRQMLLICKSTGECDGNEWRVGFAQQALR